MNYARLKAKKEKKIGPNTLFPEIILSKFIVALALEKKV
jgi:hypothetical protein